MTLPAMFAIAVGVAMIVQWTISYLRQRIPELRSEPIRIWFHIVGEMVTAVSLVASGMGLLGDRPWARDLFLVSMGMLLYTVLVSPGYFAQKGRWIWVLIFGALLALSLIATGAVLRTC